MPKKDNSLITGYIPDLATSLDKSFLQTYNRHSDSYSVFDLKPEVILVSSRISQLLCSLDSVDTDINWREILLLVELKRKLIETISKASEIAFKHQQMERMNDARIKHMEHAEAKKINLEDFGEIVDAMREVAAEFMGQDKMGLFIQKLGLVLRQAEEKSV